MAHQNLKKGDKILSIYGDKMTVLEVIDGLMVRTYEDFNNLHHISKVRRIK